MTPFSINFHELHGKCTAQSQCAVTEQKTECIIYGMSDSILGSIRGKIDNGSQADYINGRLILQRGALVPLQLTGIGYEKDMYITFDVDGILRANVPND